ncbi:release factor glutamine methyltransferase [bacterium BMS3Bbin01]|nr:release factor glutamine methyltransferase [bacterium BMS3Bbin01]
MTDDSLLRDSGLALHEAERLLMAVTGRSRSGLYTGGAPTAGERARFALLVARRRAGEPLQYLEGIIPFGPVDLRVDGRALIPRPETEYLWEQAAQAIDGAGPGTRIVDLCTGSGALAVALQKAFPEARVTATDLSEEALALAAENAAMNDVTVDFYQGDLFAALPAAMKGRIDLLVTNPPYVSEAEYRALPDEIRSYEPRAALVAGPDGDEILERIAAEVHGWLAEGGWLFCEIGETQGERALELFGGRMFCEVRDDLSGRPRILVTRQGHLETPNPGLRGAHSASTSPGFSGTS